jgi:sulfoxide reductase catalytic subunit YedY|tara:strand:+ start:899 stop:1810 length:912 start_codon:yes stop_codon:yes gene_type:complete
MKKFKYSEITPENIYKNRRKFIKNMGLAAGSMFIGQNLVTSASANTNKEELKLTDYRYVTTYNNYYEFGTGKSNPVERSQKFKTTPWDVVIDGEVENPIKISMDEILEMFPSEERIYKLRCVEGWSMVIPWLGFPLNKILKKALPTNKAKFVKFISVLDPEQMIGQRFPILDWPYKEGLRIDEAMHDLTILVTGLYGKKLPNQNGAPLRLMVPWKYGFKSSKAIVNIKLVEKMPTSSWMKASPNEYGFYSNVNPTVDHPRWSQATERVIGGGIISPRIPTTMFNGYGDEVANLYTGMDLKKYF